MTKKDAIRYLILRSIGNFLVLFAIFGVLATFGPALYYEITFKILQIRNVRYKVVAPNNLRTETFGQILKDSKLNLHRSLSLSEVLTASKEQILIPIDTEFDILIPKIGANAKVFPNVDPSNE